MSFKLGIIESTGNLLKTFGDDIKVDLIDDDNFGGARGGGRDLFSTRDSMKAQVTIEQDRMSQATVGNSLWAVINNRLYPHKVYIHHPAHSSQRISYSGITNPSATHIAKYLATDSGTVSLADFAGATEMTTADYGKLADFTNLVEKITAGKEYLNFFYQFDLSSFISNYGTEFIRRITLFMQDPRIRRVIGGTVDDFGYVVFVYNYNTSSWTEIKRQSITISSTNQQFAGLRSIEGFSQFSDYLSSNKVLFRVVNIQERDSLGTLNHSVNYVECLVNGFGVVKSNPQNENWRDPYTGSGYVDTLELQEL